MHVLVEHRMTEQTILQEVLVPRDSGCLRTAIVQNESSCAIQYDRTLRAPVLVLRGGLSHARVEIPCEGYKFLLKKFPQLLIILQTYLSSFDSFSLEVTMHTRTSIRVDLTIGTQFNKASVADLNTGVVVSKMPLIIPRNRWVQVVFHVSGILTHLFDLPPIQSLDSISLTGTCKTSRLMVCNDEEEAINAAPGDMALFAVPAYAPPVWQTAAGIATPVLTSVRRTTSGATTTTLKSVGNYLPVVGEAGNEKRRNPFRQPEGTLKSNLQSPPPPPIERNSPKLEGISTVKPPSPCEPLQDKQGSALQRGFLGNLTLSLSSPSKSLQLQQQKQKPQPQLASLSPKSIQTQQNQQNAESHSKNRTVSYIRLVNPTNRLPQRNSNAINRIRPGAVTRSELSASGSLTPASAPAAPTLSNTADTWCGITGWEEAIDFMSGANAALLCTADYAIKGSLHSIQGSLGERGATGVNNKIQKGSETQNLKTQQTKKSMELRRRPIFFPSKRRKGVGGGTESQNFVDGDTGNGVTHSIRRRGHVSRRSRIRERIRLLKEAQSSARRIHEMKKLTASELPIDPLEEAQMMVNEEIVDVMNEPRCGYGFGYLGVLRERGGFETDEGVDTNLKGALTLDISELSEDEEDGDDERE
ncbi:hypothetical protein TcYC6_0035020 [Trypanosoma cruzi]|uniref:CFA20 domain-containing protein n=1 Tax=Trypanosoma cruzi TaxID=5693 RepID=A0A7J6Y256_TRYCR|nr:hypothetical protein ECC02_006168 [Trypanosoma cruzi]KAF8288573.1 hypothetical protein TcYC6_0035020 [Trypanosoma cruzi]